MIVLIVPAVTRFVTRQTIGVISMPPDTTDNTMQATGNVATPTAAEAAIDVDSIAAAARLDGKNRERTALLKEFGVDSLEALKRKIETASQAEQEKLTTTERLQAQIKDLQTKVKVANDQIAATEARARETAITARVQVLAAQGVKIGDQVRRFRSADDVLAFLKTEQFELADDGTIKGIESALTELGTQRDYLLEPLSVHGASPLTVSPPTTAVFPTIPPSPSANTGAGPDDTTIGATDIDTVRSWY